MSTNSPTPVEPTAVPSSDSSDETAVESEQIRAAILAQLPQEAYESLIQGHHHAPHEVLGLHASSATIPGQHGGGAQPAHNIIRTIQNDAAAVSVTCIDDAGVEHHTTLECHDGELWFGATTAPRGSRYVFHVTDTDQNTITVEDCYRFLPTVTDFDLHLIGEGRHEQLWNALGARPATSPTEEGSIDGVSFTVWAPNASAVQLVGDFNGWDGLGHQMRCLGSTGVWELFVPAATVGMTYKFRVRDRHGAWKDKADPLARHTEVSPATASRVWSSSYSWNDDAWMEQRAQKQSVHAPVSVYEVHLGSWREGLGYRELAEQLPDYVADLGFTHVELLPVAQHPYGPSWGYQVTSYFATTARWGSPDDFKYLVDAFHQRGIGVIVDWVPAHFPKDDWALARFDGEPLYEHADPRQGEHPDWGTLVFNYGRHEVRNFLVANALFWLEEYHIDGLRVDAVASMLYLDYSRNDGEWVPNEFGGRENLAAISFLQEANAACYSNHPGVMMIAEESTAWDGVTRPTHDGGLGFGFKWNMGWMHDSLSYMQREPIHRQHHHNDITFSLVYAWSEHYMLPISHDEVVHGKGTLLSRAPGDDWQQMATARAYLAFMWAHPGKKLLFMGQEFLQRNEWNSGEELEWAVLDSHFHAGASDLVRDLNRLYTSFSSLHDLDHRPECFQWIDGGDYTRNILTFVRRNRAGTPLVCVVNFSPEVHHGYRLGLPHGGTWREVLNTDAECYGGSNVGNGGYIHTDSGEIHGQPASAHITIPPLGALYFTPDH